MTPTKHCQMGGSLVGQYFIVLGMFSVFQWHAAEHIRLVILD